MNLQLSSRAERDIEDIRSYLIARSPQGADRVRGSIAGALDLLEQFPHSGRATSMTGIRMLPVVRHPYLIYYTLIADEIVIVHVRHASRDAPSAGDLI